MAARTGHRVSSPAGDTHTESPRFAHAIWAACAQSTCSTSAHVSRSCLCVIRVHLLQLGTCTLNCSATVAIDVIHKYTIGAVYYRLHAKSVRSKVYHSNGPLNILVCV